MQARRSIVHAGPPEPLEPGPDRSGNEPGSTRVTPDENPQLQRPQEPTWTPRAQAALRTAEAWAARLRHGHVGTEHLLLALVQDRAGVAAQVLEELAPAGAVHDALLKVVSSRAYYTGSALELDEDGHAVVDPETGLPRQHPVEPAP